MQKLFRQILAADVARYSRLMAAEAADTLGSFKAVQAEEIDPAVSQSKSGVPWLLTN